jgi:hypothetical protein
MAGFAFHTYWLAAFPAERLPSKITMPKVSQFTGPRPGIDTQRESGNKAGVPLPRSAARMRSSSSRLMCD